MKPDKSKGLFASFKLFVDASRLVFVTTYYGPSRRWNLSPEEKSSLPMAKSFGRKSIWDLFKSKGKLGDPGGRHARLLCQKSAHESTPITLFTWMQNRPYGLTMANMEGSQLQCGPHLEFYLEFRLRRLALHKIPIHQLLLLRSHERVFLYRSLIAGYTAIGCVFGSASYRDVERISRRPMRY